MNELAIAVGIILFPGLIATVICDKIAVHSQKWDAFKYAIYSFVLGVFCYIFLQALESILYTTLGFIGKALCAPYPVLKVWTIISTQKVVVSPAEVLQATFIAPIVAGLAAWIFNHKLLHRAAQKLKISTKYGDENLFSFYLNAQDLDWVYVRDTENKLTYQGKITSFSECDSMQELVLSEVSVFSYPESEELYSVPLIYLTKPRGKFIIEAIPADRMGA